MDNENLPLQSLTIDELFNSAEPRTFEIPIYQRNYAWGRNEIGTLVQDVLDASETKGRYHIGTLVVYSKGDNVYEIIDGQQRVTTIYLLLKALEKSRISAEAVHRIQFRTTNKLTYRARSKSSRTLEKIEKLGEGGVLTEVKGEDDRGIVEGYKFVCEVLDDMESDVLAKFAEYFKKNVIIVFYEVPMDIDLNHYFEVMNSRGEQLEQHEVVKADLLSAFVDIEPKNENAGGSNEDSSKFTFIWECCSDMSTYVQKKFYDSFKSPTEGKSLTEGVFGKTFDTFIAGSFDEIEIGTVSGCTNKITLDDLITEKDDEGGIPDEDDSREQFDPIIDFPNFLLIVLKLTCIRKGMFDFASITLDDRENKEERMMIILDDKELKRQFDSVLNSLPGTKREKAEFVKEFAFNLLKCRFYLDNYIVHRDNGDGKPDNSPWELERWRRADDEKEPAAVSLFEDEEWRRKCRHLLSMFEVSYSPHQRKNYVLYCLLFLTEYGGVDGPSYYAFLSRLARRFLFGVYFWKSGGNENERVNEKNNAPLPGSFDLAVLGDGDAICREGGGWLASDPPQSTDALTVMEMRLGDGTKEVTRIPLFVFNYLDYLLWELYYDFARSKEGEDKKDNSAFFSQLGCGDFGLAPFKSFYFSATRSSLEHFFSQSEQRLDAQTRNQETEAPMDEAMINRFGNFAMISPDANSSASDLPPSAKRDRYAQYQKRDAVSINSLKFRIMLKICEEEKGWGKKQIVSHQSAMTDVLLGKAFDSLKKMCADTR